MKVTEAEKRELEKLVEDMPVGSFGIPLPRKRLTNKRKTAEPHLRPHKVKGRTYYTYCRGIDKEVYLGDADSILQAVKLLERTKVGMVRAKSEGKHIGRPRKE